MRAFCFFAGVVSAHALHWVVDTYERKINFRKKEDQFGW